MVLRLSLENAVSGSGRWHKSKLNNAGSSASYLQGNIMNISLPAKRFLYHVVSVLCFRRLNVESFGRALWIAALIIFSSRIFAGIGQAFLYSRFSMEGFASIGIPPALKYTFVIQFIVTAAWSTLELLACRFMLEVSHRMLASTPPSDDTSAICPPRRYPLKNVPF